jgi:ribosomal protein S18 acetylase RimI-like enzyme
MKLVPTPLEHLPLLQRWFPDRDSAFRWGGPRLRHPFTDDTFAEDIRWGGMAAWSLVGRAGDLLGFGQYYLNHGRCHLARLAVDPARRRQGLGRRLVGELVQVGMRDLGVEECSLFVLNDNHPAIRCYCALGFESRPFPGWQEPFGEESFMIRPGGVDRGMTSA